MLQTIPTHGTFSRGKKTAAGATPFAQFVPPGGPVMSSTSSLPDKPAISPWVSHITDLVYVVPNVAHLVTIMRPLNYTTFSADAAAAQAVVNITANPGAWETAGVYKYSLPNGRTSPSTANNLLAANDYVVYQTAAGQWVMDTVASISSLAVTLTTNLPTGGVLEGGLLYHFGISSDTDPATNEAHQAFDILAAASGTELRTYQSQGGAGLWHAYHPGDPLIVYSNNATTAGFIELVAGYYASK